jgi:N-methylhydantoinase A/oxoprolinase/acetone carboxylase beta subunit
MESGPTPAPDLRLAIDVGGTFTDAVLWQEGGERLAFAKVPSTPGRFADGVVAAAREALSRLGRDAEAVVRLVHSSTVAANVVAERRGARVGLITTAGFRDVLELQRTRRDSLFDLYYEKPAALVPRALRLEVPERIAANGDVVTPLDEAAARAAIERLRDAGCEALAVALLFSFVNPVHERRIQALAAEIMPGAFVSLSSTVNPEFREYERTSTTVIDAYVKPEVTAYYRELDRRLRASGFAGRLDIFHSGGGIMAAGDAMERPVLTIESGPAAGATAAAHIARSVGLESAIAFDMGGTTAKACLVERGQLKTVNAMLVERHPVRAPVIDLIEISGGGGTIAWVDETGLLRVGPRSAGAAPGPACYGRGGDQPTITDANAVLGYYPAHLTGGSLALDFDASHRVIRERLCAPLDMGVDQAALGILRIANAAMEGAIRLVTTQRGIDPRKSTLIAFGGAGPVHAAFLATQIGIPRVLIPPAPGNVNAYGALVAETRYDYHTTFYSRLDDVDAAVLEGAFADLERGARASLADLPAADRAGLTAARLADLRFLGQGFELTVPLAAGLDCTTPAAALGAAFREAYRARYKQLDPSAPLEIVAIRLVLSLSARPAALRLAGTEGLEGGAKAQRAALFPGHETRHAAAVWDRASLPAGWRARGPAIVEEYSATTVVPPGCTVWLEDGNLVIETGATP